MPCSYEETPQEIEARRLRQTINQSVEEAIEPYKKALNELTHENDQLREIVLRIADKDSVPVAIWAKIQDSQVEHRQEDLRRLEKTFNEALRALANATLTKNSIILIQDTTKRLNAVLNADPKLPLADQLGFDPDDF